MEKYHIPVDPELPANFDNTPHDARPRGQIDDWWGKPFIRTCRWEDMADSYDAYLQRVRNLKDFTPESSAEFNRRQAIQKGAWFETYPTGIRYDVRCLDGGAWDRSTSWGMVGSLEEAIAIAEAGSPWHQVS